MSLNAILNSGTSGLIANQAALRTVADNIANVGTPGFARRNIAFEAQAGGVRIGDVQRIADRFLTGAARASAGAAASADILAAAYDRLSASLGRPGETGLAGRLSRIGDRAIEMASDDTSITRRAFLAAIDDFLATARTIDGEIEAMRGAADIAATNTVDEANVLLSQIERLNADVASANLLGTTDHAAADRRDRALARLAELVAIETRPGTNGAIVVETSSGVALLDPEAVVLNIADAQVTALRGGEVQGMFSGQTLGGALGAHLELSAAALPAARQELAALVDGIVTTLNDLHRQGNPSPPPAVIVGAVTGRLAEDPVLLTRPLEILRSDAAGNPVQRIVIAPADLPSGADLDDLAALVASRSGGTVALSFDEGRVNIVGDDQGGLSLGGAGADAFKARYGIGALVSGGRRPALAATDQLNAAPGSTIGLALRKADGGVMAEVAWTAAGGETLSDLVAALNAGGLDAFGGVTIGDDGGLVTADGTRLDIVSDSTVRGDSGVAIGGLLGLPADISDIAFDPALAADPGLMSSRPGLAESYVGALGASESSLSDLVGRAGLMASSAEARAEDATARASLAEARVRDVSGVSLDEEMTKMIAFQNSYAAAARVVSTARDMYDILLQMGR